MNIKDDLDFMNEVRVKYLSGGMKVRFRIVEKNYERLEKHKNDLGDLLAKREEQLDKIKEVVKQKFSTSRRLEDIKQILEGE